MDTNQIYELVNTIAEQTLGQSNIKATDTSTLVALGTQILNSTGNAENFMNTLVQRIGRTIISYRKYTNSLKGIVYNDIEWGAVVQKIKVQMPKMVADDAYDLQDGVSIDMYKVQKPKAKQKFFVNRTPYSTYISIQEFQLKEAFTNASAMGSFISAIFGEVQNSLELSIENLGRLTIANFIALTGTAQRVNLVTEYNAATGETITADKALYDNSFLRFAIGRMNRMKKKMTAMSTLYNKEGETRHTPLADQRFAILDDFQTACETQVQYAAFNAEYVKLESNIMVPYWQSVDEPTSINLEVSDGAGGSSAVVMENIVGFLFDREALGTYRKEEAVLTTPMNARGRYTNTFWHEKQMWFNYLSENGIVFTLN